MIKKVHIGETVVFWGIDSRLYKGKVIKKDKNMLDVELLNGFVKKVNTIQLAQ